MRLRFPAALSAFKLCALVLFAVFALLLENAPSAALAANVPATIQDDSLSPSSFSPNPLTINAGDSVTWTNNGPAVHTVTSDAGQAMSFDSGNLAVGAIFNQVFSQAGTFKYHCSIHAGMTGTVVVQAAAPSGGATAPAAASTSAPAAASTSTSTAARVIGTPTTSASAASPGAQLPHTGDGGSSGSAFSPLIALLLVVTGAALVGIAVSIRTHGKAPR